MGALSLPKKAPLTICQTVDLQCMLEFPLSHSFPLSSLSELQITTLFWRSGFALETSSWRLSQIKLFPEVMAWDEHPWKNCLETEMRQIQTRTHVPERKASNHAGVGDRLGVLYIPGKKPHYTLARKSRALHTQPCRKLMCIAHQICHWLSGVGFNVKWHQISGAYKGQLGISGLGMWAQNVETIDSNTHIAAHTRTHTCSHKRTLKLISVPIKEYSPWY